MVVVGAVLSSVYFELVHNLFEAIFLVWVGGGRWQYPQKEFQEWNGMESFLIRGIGARWLSVGAPLYSFLFVGFHSFPRVTTTKRKTLFKRTNENCCLVDN